ncbi:MAG: hypothetical protein D6785_10105, partial [Planctomycetota bacterium]
MISEQNSFLGRIQGIVFADIRDISRRPAYIFSLVFFSCAIYFSKDMAFFAFDKRFALIQEIGLSCLLVSTFWISYLASLIGVNQELETKTIYTLLSKPLTRGDFIISKYVSIFGLSLLANLFLSLILLEPKSAA